MHNLSKTHDDHSIIVSTVSNIFLIKAKKLTFFCHNNGYCSMQCTILMLLENWANYVFENWANYVFAIFWR